MPFDAHQNLAIATVVTPPTPATTGTTLTVGAGEGARFPVGREFNVTIWPFDMAPTPVTAEIGRVTARTGDQLTLIRQAEPGGTARAIVAGDLIAATVTVKALTDIESGINFPNLGTTGNASIGGGVIVGGGLTVNGGAVVFGADTSILRTTAPGADNGVIAIMAGGGYGAGRGAIIVLNGNQTPSTGGMVLQAGSVPGGSIDFKSGGEILRGRIGYAGGLNFGGSFTDPGAGRARFEGYSTLRGTVPAAPNATPVTLFTITITPGIDTTGMYLVTAGLGAADAANYGAFATVVYDGGSARIVANNANLMTITLSGLNVQATQSSSGTQPLHWVALKVG